MKLDAALARALNQQVAKEFNAAHLYLAMSAWFAERNLDGFATWMMRQGDEERSHAMRIYEFLLDRGASVTLEAIAAPKAAWKTPMQVFEAAGKHEAMVSESIVKLYEQARKARDYPTEVMLQWFLTEQVEEEKTSSTLVERLRMVGDSPAGLLMLDRELGARPKESDGGEE